MSICLDYLTWEKVSLSTELSTCRGHCRSPGCEEEELYPKSPGFPELRSSYENHKTCCVGHPFFPATLSAEPHSQPSPTLCPAAALNVAQLSPWHLPGMPSLVRHHTLVHVTDQAGQQRRPQTLSPSV